MASPELPYQTYRVAGLSTELGEPELFVFLSSQLDNFRYLSLAECDGSETQLATVTIKAKTDEQAYVLKLLRDLPWSKLTASSVYPIKVDSDFFGLTPLNACSVPIADQVE